MIIIVQRNPWIFIIGGGRKSKNLDEDIKIKFNFRHKIFATPNFSRSFRGSIKFADQNQSSVWFWLKFTLPCHVNCQVLDRFLAVLATRRPPHRGGGFKLYGFGSSTQRLLFCGCHFSYLSSVKRRKFFTIHNECTRTGSSVLLSSARSRPCRHLWILSIFHSWSMCSEVVPSFFRIIKHKTLISNISVIRRWKNGAAVKVTWRHRAEGE